MSARSITAHVVAGILFASASTASFAAIATESSSSGPISIPEQSLSAALVTLATRSGRNVLFNPKVVAGRRSAPVSGAATFEAAIDAMLRGTGLRSTTEQDGSVTVTLAAVTPPPAAPTAPAPSTPKPTASTEEDMVGGLEEVVVTAEKRETSLQKTPVAISVLTSQDWEQRGFTRLNDLGSGAVPSLRIAPFAGRASAITIGMRGVVPPDATQMSRDPTVGIYADGVYLGRVQGLGTELYDVERVEVLKGPQGTLFGRNAVGGALSIVTKKPTGEFGLRQTVGARNYDGFNYKGNLDLPRFAGVSAKIDASYAQRDGYVDNPLPDQWEWGRSERMGGRISLLWEPMDEISVLFSSEISQDKSTPTYVQLRSLYPNAAPLAPIVYIQDGRADEALVGALLEPSVGKIRGNTLTASWKPSDSLEIKSITGTRNVDQSQYDNSGALFSAFVPNGSLSRYSLAWVKQHQFSQELQLIGSANRLKYVTGLYYFSERGWDSAYAPMTARWNATGTDVVTYPEYLPRPFPDRASTAHAESRAVFGQFTYTPPALSDRLSVTLGGRYTSDRKAGALTKLSGQPRDITFEFDENRFDPAATVAFNVSDNVNTYVRWGTAYRAGGADSRSTTYRSFGPEEIESWELGIKTELFERRARINMAAYYSNYENLQISFSSPANLSAMETINTDDPAKIKGAELDIAVAPLDGLVLNLGYAYTSWKVEPQLNPFTGVRSPTLIVYTPRNAVSLAADYGFSVADVGKVDLHLGWTGQSSFYSSATPPIPLDGYKLLDARIELSDFARTSGDWTLALWGKNLTNEEYVYYTFATQGTGLINGNIGGFNEPRTYGIETTLRF